MADIVDTQPSEWLNALPDRSPFLSIVANDQLGLEQKAAYAMARFTLAYGEESVAQRGRPSLDDEGLAAYGAQFISELYGLLCADKKYKSARQAILKEAKVGRTAIVAYISTYLAPVLGMASAPVAASVAITLSIIGQLGLNTWCATQAARRRREYGEES
jgi:hypothetical protein